MGLAELLQSMNEEQAASFFAAVGKADGELDDDDLSNVVGGFAIDPGKRPKSAQELADMLRQESEALRAQNKEMRDAGRDAAIQESQASAERMKQEARLSLALGVISGQIQVSGLDINADSIDDYLRHLE